jgi:polar amino acid transport system substrate-binding protein
MARDFAMDRRAYLATVGTAGVAGLAGCPYDPRDGNGGGDGTPTEDGTGGGGELRLATAADFPPFATTDEGVLVGLDVDLAQTVVERAGYDIGAWVDIRFEALVQELNADQFDLVAAAVSTALGRREEVAFTTPYYGTDQAVLVRSAGEFHPEEEADLEGAFLGAQAGTTSEAEIERLVEEGVVGDDDHRAFTDFTRAVEALENGTLDALVVDRRAGQAVVAAADVEVAFGIETDEEYALAMRLDDDRFADVEAALTEVLEDGTFDDLVAEHLEGE